MKKDAEKTDWTALLKTSLPLSQQTYDEVDDALKNDKIYWEDLNEDLKQAYNRFGVDRRDYIWNDMLTEGRCMADDYFGIENSLNFFQLMEFNCFSTKQKLYNFEGSLIPFEWELFKKGLNEGYLKFENCPQVVKKAYEEFLQKERESEKKGKWLLENIKLPLSQTTYEELIKAIGRYIKWDDISDEIKDAYLNFNKEVINDKFRQK